MRRTVLAATALVIFGFGMTASMAQQPQQDSATIRVNPPVQSSPPIQTQPTQMPNLNTSRNPYQGRHYYMQTPVQTPKR